MPKATKQNTTKPIDIDFVARTVLVLANGVATDNREQIRSAAQALADECGIPMPNFTFA